MYKWKKSSYSHLKILEDFYMKLEVLYHQIIHFWQSTLILNTIAL
jgi:hypothetical protein